MKKYLVDEFDIVVSAYRRHSLDLGFIPKSTLYNYYYSKGRIKFIGDSFIIIGSERKEKIKIEALYVSPENRNTTMVHDLLKLLPKDREYHLYCTQRGVAFWKYHGLDVKSISNTNKRQRNIYHLEGYLR